MDSLLEAQHDLYQRIRRTVENLKKAEAGKLTLGLVQSTLSLLDKKWALFKDQHTDLRFHLLEQPQKARVLCERFYINGRRAVSDSKRQAH